MKILLTGGSGQLGRSLMAVLPTLGHEVIAPSHTMMDVTNREAVYTHLAEVRPQVVIHCAAYNKVDLAEKERDRCFSVNTRGTENIALACASMGVRMIFISTDYVFDGRKDGPYLPLDDRAPLSVYGWSKMQGEDITLRTSDRNAVIRTAWLFGPSRDNFVQSILRAAEKNAELCVVCDQIGSPTYSEDLAYLLGAFIQTDAAGVFHGINEGICSRAAYAREILRLANRSCVVHDVLSSEYPSVAKRPLNSQLSTACIRDIGLAELPPWQDALRRYINSEIHL